MNDRLLEQIVSRIVEAAQPEKVILFGSRARGHARPESDFDLLVIKESDEPRYRRAVSLYGALAGLLANVDVLVYTPQEVWEWSAVPEAFVTTAVREGRILYERNSSYSPAALPVASPCTRGRLAMKERADLVRGLLRKAASDAAAAQSLLDGGNFDAACFHAQQAAEKYFKAFLIHHGTKFPLTYDLAQLTELCASIDPSFRSLNSSVAPLTPCAVKLRYDDAFWPSLEVAQEAGAAALAARDFVLCRLPLDPT